MHELGGAYFIIGLTAFFWKASYVGVLLSIWGIQVWEEGIDIPTIVSHCIYQGVVVRVFVLYCCFNVCVVAKGLGQVVYVL